MTAAAGRVVAGRYELATLIGQGGMGQVWTAYDQRLDRRVAVKLLRPDRVVGQDADELRRRFARECRVTAQVDHPGLVTVHDAGSEGEELFLVMQYVDGADLSDHLAEHDPYPWQWAVAVAAQLCAVLSAVHAVPIVHRDLKPRNVMVKQDGTVTVLDLGVASVMDTDTTRLTRTGSPIGSPAYMAPEQAMGGAVGPYTDLYALGVLIHELLSGDVPFTGSTALGVLHRHLYEPPPPIRRLRPEVPEALEHLVLRLLAKDPQHRPASAQDVYEDLALLLPARGTPPGHRSTPPAPSCARTPLAGPGAHARTLARPRRAGRREDQCRRRRRRGEAPSGGGPHHPGRRRPRRDPAHRRTAARRALPGRTHPAQAVRGHAHGRRPVPARAARTAPPRRRTRRRDRSGRPQSLRYRYEAAQCLEQLGDPAAALAEYRALLPYYENQYAADDPELAFDVRRRIGHLLLALGDRAAAHDTLARLLHDVERLHGPGHPLAAEIRRTLQWLGQVRG